MRPGYSRDRLLNGIDDLNCLVDRRGIEPRISGCKPDVFPLALAAQFVFFIFV